MIKAITEQNASPLMIFINKNDIKKFPMSVGTTYWQGISSFEFPKSYEIFLTTELKCTSLEEVACLVQIGEAEEIWGWDDTGLKFEATKVYPDDELSRILKDCNIALGNVEIGFIKFD